MEEVKEKLRGFIQGKFSTGSKNALECCIFLYFNKDNAYIDKEIWENVENLIKSPHKTPEKTFSTEIRKYTDNSPQILMVSHEKLFTIVNLEPNSQKTIDGGPQKFKLRDIIRSQINNYIKEFPITNRYWRISPGSQAKDWENCVKNSTIGISYQPVAKYLGNKILEYEKIDDLKKGMEEFYQRYKDSNEPYIENYSEPKKINNRARQIWDFVKNIQKNDIILVNFGMKKIIGMGKISENKIWIDINDEYPIKRSVEWIMKDLTIPIPKSINEYKLRDTIKELTIEDYEQISILLNNDGISIFDKEIINKMRRDAERLFNEEGLSSEEDLSKYYSTFKNRFGPEILEKLEGKELLETIYDLQNKNSLVYWLEFKNDDEFPAIFGSIAGGSAAKYGIYRRKETGKWNTGTLKKTEFTESEAIEIAKKHRDQLIRGCELLEKISSDGKSEEYKNLQKEMDELSPDVSKRAWGHKYFSLMFPDKIDDFHSPEFQKFHLIKLLINPIPGAGRYHNAWYFVKLKKTLNLPINSITTILNKIHGKPHKYWIYQVRNLDNKKELIDYMKTNSCIILPIAESIDLNIYSEIGYTNLKQELTNNLEIKNLEKFPSKTIISQLIKFIKKLSSRDIVLVIDGVNVIDIGRLDDDRKYIFNNVNKPYGHQLSLDWLNIINWNLETINLDEDLLFEIKDFETLIDIESKILNKFEKEVDKIPYIPKNLEITQLKELPLISQKIKEALDRKSQVILYGPPGTGKTYWAEKAACELASRIVFKKLYESLTEDEKQIIYPSFQKLSLETNEKKFENKGFVRMCTFHPSFSYEEFVEGYRALTNSSEQLIFELQKGIFFEMCLDASKDEKNNYYLIIDEINRGDIPRIFGEIITVLEKDKRSKPIILASGKIFRVPENVYIIGTMNTADRSIALMDIALRRRFSFVEIMPDPTIFKSIVIENLPLKSWLEAINSIIIKEFGNDGRNLQIGHSYFLEKTGPIDSLAKFLKILKEEIFPLLEEYCYDNFELMEKFIDSSFIEKNTRSINWSKFENSDKSEIIRALLSPFPSLITEKEVINSDNIEELDEEELNSEDIQDN